MSHFTVLVIADDHEAALQPFHEFECTGTNDQHVQDIDQTEDLKAEFDGATRSMVRLADGALVGRYDNCCYRDPTAEEAAKIGPLGGTGCANGIIYSSKDWGDGRGYRTKVRATPEGAEETEVPYESFAAWLDDNYGRKIVPFGSEPDLECEHKYGYAMVDAAGEITKIIDRTNPNKKWDWYQVGGRWPGKLILKNGKRADQAASGEVNWEAMLADRAEHAARAYDAIKAIVGDRQLTTWAQAYAKVEAKEWAIDQAREHYNSQPIIKELQDAKAIDFFDGAETLSKVMATQRDDFIKRESETNSTTWALLHDGVWTERGRMGWFGMSDASDDSTADYVTKFWETVRALPADAIVTVVDCHI